MKMFKSKERGQSLVELSISLLVLLYLLAGAAEFGVAFFQYVQLRDAAQEGALYGSMNPNTLGPIETRARSASNSPIDLSDTSQVTVTVIATDKTTNTAKDLSTACEGDALTVTVAYDHIVFMPFMSRIIGPKIPLHGTVTDTILSPVC